MVKRSSKVLWVLTLSYFISYLVRHCYSAVLVAIISDLGTTRQLASIAVTGSFFSYGLGQFVSGSLGDRFQPRKIVFWGLLITSCINLSVACMPNIYWIIAIWVFSGFFHSLIWPSIVRISTTLYPDTDAYRHAVGIITKGGYWGQILMYLLAAAFVAWLSWRALFLTTGFISLAFSILWYRQTRQVECPKGLSKRGCDDTTDLRLSFSVLRKAGMIPILVTTMGIGFLRDGIATWMPVYFTDVFQMDQAVSLLSSIVLPVCGVWIVSLVEIVAKKVRNDMTCCAISATVSGVAGLVLAFVFGRCAGCDLLLMATISCGIRGCSLPVTTYVPQAFEPYGRVATVSGIIDGIVYMGSAAASYILAFVADQFGWGVNLGTWALVAFLCLLCSVKAAIPWKRFSNRM